MGQPTETTGTLLEEIKDCFLSKEEVNKVASGPLSAIENDIQKDIKEVIEESKES